MVAWCGWCCALPPRVVVAFACGGRGVPDMNLFVPYDDSDLSRFALREACLMMTSRDTIFVMAVVIVPSSLDIDVPAGEVWKQTCAAEVQLQAARSYAERIDFGVELRCVRVQAHTRANAIVAGAIYYEADT